VNAADALPVLLLGCLLVSVLVVALGPTVTRWHDARVRPSPEPPPVAIPEIPPLDPMVLCPSCALLGYHSLDEIPPVSNPIRTVPGADGELIEIHVWGGGRPGYWRRECCFCQHVWAVPLGKEEVA
jgi:hypothetical protein